MESSKEIRNSILKDLVYIKSVISSSITVEQLETSRNMVKNWAGKNEYKIRNYTCPFYMLSDIRKTFEVYRRSYKEFNDLMAKKRVELSPA